MSNDSKRWKYGETSALLGFDEEGAERRVASVEMPTLEEAAHPSAPSPAKAHLMQRIESASHVPDAPVRHNTAEDEAIGGYVPEPPEQLCEAHAIGAHRVGCLRCNVSWDTWPSVCERVRLKTAPEAPVPAAELDPDLDPYPEQTIAAGQPGAKPSNPKDGMGMKKVPISVVPFPVLWELGVSMTEGGLKYGRHNYRVIGVRASVYIDATVSRHLGAWWEGEDDDPDSGLNHVSKAIASLVVLRDAMIRGTWIDDRPPASDPAILRGLNKKVEALMEKFPEGKRVPAYTELGERER